MTLQWSFKKKYQGWKLHVVFGGGTRDKMSILRRKEISLLRLGNPALTTFVVKKYWLKKKCSKPLAHVMSKDLIGTKKDISIYIISELAVTPKLMDKLLG